ncbi:exodeoxyribonuclease VII small subunit [Companilactobacillus metriopterae]|uniref:exodeoxyribonuclease VII small subunit n=1 Tax=Companilactobacillus metriopterae TaxID=1909267 RepID=UPI00100A5878|nr:exodeoxyribonuclease VII small subunit [Companilactobacillus metriopterae]
MVEKKKTFEENLTELENIVKNLEEGNVPLEEAMNNFKKGIDLSKELQSTLDQAEETVTKVMSEDGTLKDMPEITTKED